MARTEVSPPMSLLWKIACLDLNLTESSFLAISEYYCARVGAVVDRVSGGVWSWDFLAGGG